MGKLQGGERGKDLSVHSNCRCRILLPLESTRYGIAGRGDDDRKWAIQEMSQISIFRERRLERGEEVSFCFSGRICRELTSRLT
jgi:hypothetical protein